MHAKTSRHFCRFSTFVLNIFLQRHNLFNQDLGTSGFFLEFNKGPKSLPSNFLTIDFLLTIKEQEMFISTMSVKNYQNAFYLLHN